MGCNKRAVAFKGDTRLSRVLFAVRGERKNSTDAASVFHPMRPGLLPLPVGGSGKSVNGFERAGNGRREGTVACDDDSGGGRFSVAPGAPCALPLAPLDEGVAGSLRAVRAQARSRAAAALGAGSWRSALGKNGRVGVGGGSSHPHPSGHCGCF